MRRRVFLAAAALFVGVVAHAGAQGTGGFLTVFEDLPLMPGLTEEKGSEVVFDSADGRIVEAYASGNVERADVLAFYAETLPQLGWRPAGTGRFQRERETLVIEFPGGPESKEVSPASLTVGFRLAPGTD